MLTMPTLKKSLSLLRMVRFVFMIMGWAWMKMLFVRIGCMLAEALKNIVLSMLKEKRGGY